MAAKTDPINTSNPAGNSDPKQGDDYIRTLAKAVLELLTVDHYIGVANPWGSDASGDETGEHAKVTFHAPLTSPPTTSATQQAIFTSGMDSGAAELFVRPLSDGTPIQLTSGGEVLFASLASMAQDTYLTGLNAAEDGTIDLIKANSDDVPEIKTAAVLSTSGDPTTAAGIVCKEYAEGYADAAPKAQMKADNVAAAVFGVGSQSCTMANGMIIKTGYSTTDGTTTITFDEAFPGGVLSVNVTTVFANAPNDGIAVNTVSASKFDVETSGAYTGFYWIAIGY